MLIPKSLRLKNFMSFQELNFIFRNGAAIAILGKNYDDPGQKVNGAGKTAFIEGMAVGYSGSPLRDVKTKELINDRGAEFAEVELVHFNTETGEDFSIYRKIFANSKSAEYSAKIGGRDQSDRYSDFNMFNDFVWRTLGVSKEDFFANFLITREDDYKPFLKMTDAPKKAMINRFSGADKVDVVFPLIEADQKKVTDEVLQVEKELLQNTTKQELLTEQLLAEEEAISEDAKNRTISQKEADLLSFIDQAENSASMPVKEADLIRFQDALQLAKDNAFNHQVNSEIACAPFNEAIAVAELKVSNHKFSRDFEFDILQFEVQKEKKQTEINIQNAKLPQVKAKFDAEIKAILTEEIELKKSLAIAEKELSENELFESEVNKQLQDSIECPKCHHHFSLRDKTFNYEEAQEALPLVVETIAEIKVLIAAIKVKLNQGIQEKKEAVNKKVIAAGEGIKNEITALNAQFLKLGQEEFALKTAYQDEKRIKQGLVDKVQECKDALQVVQRTQANDLRTLENQVRKAEMTLAEQRQELKHYQDEILRMHTEIDRLKLLEPDRKKVTELEKQIENLILAEEGIKNKLEAKRKEKESVDAWEINFKNFKSHLANKSIKNIQDYTNLFLEAMGSNLAIKIDGYKTLANKKIKEQISTTVLRDGFDAGSYGKFSGGERGRIDICTILAMQELININTPNGVDLLIVDEIMDQVDVMGLESIINSLQVLGKTIMIVSQQEINTLPNHTLTIQKRNKVSSICA